MSKQCPYCNAEISKKTRSEFVKVQFLEFLFCKDCEKKLYATLQPRKRVTFNVLNILSYVIPIVSIFLIIGGYVYFSAKAFVDKSLSALRLPVLAVFVFGFVFVTRRKIMRFVYWNLSDISKTQFVE